MAGYPVGNSEKNDEKYLCRLCTSILREPVQLECGDRFCRSCVNNAKEKISDCKICGENTMQLPVWLDRGFIRDMNSLKLYCQNCSWNGSYKNYDDHLKKNHSRYNAENTDQTIINNLLELPSGSSHQNSSINLENVSFNSQLQVFNDSLFVSTTTMNQIQTISDNCGFMWKIRFDLLLTGQTAMIRCRLMTNDGHVEMCLKAKICGDATENAEKYLEIQILSLPGEFDSILKWPFERQLTMGLYNVATYQTDNMSSCQLSFELPNRQNATKNSPIEIFKSIFPLRLFSDKENVYVADDLIHVKILLCQEALPAEILQEAMNIDHFKPEHFQIESIHRLREQHAKSHHSTELSLV